MTYFDPNMQLRAVDISGNPVKEIPEHFFESLELVRKLKMDRCELDNESMDWKLLAKLKHLETLSLQGNRLTLIPSVIGWLPSLRTLELGSNDIKDVCSELSKLNQLTVLDLSGNKIKFIPENAFPSSLEALSLEKNDLRMLLPMRLPHLKMLQLECNPRCASLFCITSMYRLTKLYYCRLEILPCSIFKDMPQLTVLKLSKTAISHKSLEDFVGFDSFESRRKTKYDKKLAMQVLSDARDFFESSGRDKFEKFK